MQRGTPLIYGDNQHYHGLPWGLSSKESAAMQEMQFRSRGWEDPLGEEMAIHSSIPAWEIPQTEEPDGLQSMVLQSWT